MRTVGCSGCLGGWRGVSAQGVSTPGVSAWGVSAWWKCLIRQTPAPAVDRILDTCFLKHYLSATTIADGNNENIIDL